MGWKVPSLMPIRVKPIIFWLRKNVLSYGNNHRLRTIPNILANWGDRSNKLWGIFGSTHCLLKFCHCVLRDFALLNNSTSHFCLPTHPPCLTLSYFAWPPIPLQIGHHLCTFPKCKNTGRSNILPGWTIWARKTRLFNFRWRKKPWAQIILEPTCMSRTIKEA